MNYVWNYCNDVQRQAVTRGRVWPSRYDLGKLTSGACGDLGVLADTVGEVCGAYVKSRRTSKRQSLRWRTSKSLGWVPFRAANLRPDGDDFIFRGQHYRVFNPRLIDRMTIRDGGSFSQDAKGNWYLNVCIEVPEAPQRKTARPVAVDLGLKAIGTLSTGETIEAPRFFRALEDQLAKAQRAHKRRQATNIHARIGNARRDFLHKLSHRLVTNFDFIAVGNVNASALAKTSMAKSVLDAGWSTFRQQLAYKAIRHGAVYEEVNEAYSTQTCSDCGSVSGPKGREGLVVREWTCGECGTTHDRDVNAARNILLRSGHRAHVDGAAKERKCQQLVKPEISHVNAWD